MSLTGDQQPQYRRRFLFAAAFSRSYSRGTDDLGRDHLARLLEAGQVSLSIGFPGSTSCRWRSVSRSVLSPDTYRGFADLMTLSFGSLPPLNSVPLILHHPDHRRLPRARNVYPDPRALGLLRLDRYCAVWCAVRRFSLREREFVISARAIGAQSRLRIMFSPTFCLISAVNHPDQPGNRHRHHHPD